MANFQVTDKTLLTSVDRAADSFLVYDASASALKRTVVNNMLDLTTHPVGIDDVQTLTNKTLTTPTLTVNDNVFTVQDNSDTTKKLQLQLSGITTGTTRTLTIPDANDTIVGIAATQTLTNKTLTSPVINTATISNPTLTVDTVAEYTAANGVTVDGLNIKDGLINTANSIDSAAYIDGSIDPEHLISGTGSSWVWQSWSPTYTNLTVGNGTTTAKYAQIGKTVTARIRFVFGTTSVMGSGPTFTLPVTSADSSSLGILGTGLALAAATAYLVSARRDSSTVCQIVTWDSGGAYLTTSGVTALIPNTWANNDYFDIYLTYEAA